MLLTRFFILALMLPMLGCEMNRYLDYDTSRQNVEGYLLAPVLESTPTRTPRTINGTVVHESYPIVFRFFLESNLDKRPERLEVFDISLIGVESRKQLVVEAKSTERVNRPTRLSHSQETLTMHFILYEFGEDELPFEDYKIRCRVRIHEEGGSVLEEALEFDMRSSIVSGVR